MMYQLIKLAGITVIFSLLIDTYNSPVCYAQSLEAELSKVGKHLATQMQKAGHSSTTLKIDGPTTYSSSGPAMIKEVLGESLSKNGLRVTRTSADIGMVVKLKIREVKDEDTGVITSLALTLTFDVVDRSEQAIASYDSLSIAITDRSEVARILNVPFELGPDNSSTNTALVNGVRKPDQAARGTIARSKSDGLFGVEVVVDGQSKPISIEDGFAFVDLKKSDECEIALVNDAPFEVAVRLTLDGVDCFWFSPEKSKLWIIGAQSRVLIKGWQINDTTAQKFRIVPFEQSVAAMAGVTGEIGVINASFYRTFMPGEAMPPDERPEPSTKSLGFGAGDKFKNLVKNVQRQVSRIRGNVPVRYTKPY